MPIPNPRRLAVCAALVAACAQVVSAADILIVDAKSSPESLTVAPGGLLIVGSASTPFVYKVRAGATTAEKFIDASAEGPGTFFLGMLADAATNTLWTCQLTPVPNTTPPQRHSALRGFDIATGAQKLRWELPGDAVSVMISRSVPTRRFTSPTPAMPKSSGWRPARPRPSCSWRTARRSPASTGLRFSTARST